MVEMVVDVMTSFGLFFYSLFFHVAAVMKTAEVRDLVASLAYENLEIRALEKRRSNQK